MEYKRLEKTDIDCIWNLQIKYKGEIGEDLPSSQDKLKLENAIENGDIIFFGCVDNENLIACCSISKTFSTFNYGTSGVFEDFYILREYRHKGIAKELVKFAFVSSGVSTLTVGSASCDVEMYKSLGFKVSLGNLLAYEG